jgi:hypothetical protein
MAAEADLFWREWNLNEGEWRRGGSYGFWKRGYEGKEVYITLTWSDLEHSH